MLPCYAVHYAINLSSDERENHHKLGGILGAFDESFDGILEDITGTLQRLLRQLVRKPIDDGSA